MVHLRPAVKFALIGVLLVNLAWCVASEFSGDHLPPLISEDEPLTSSSPKQLDETTTSYKTTTELSSESSTTPTSATESSSTKKDDIPEESSSAASVSLSDTRVAISVDNKTSQQEQEIDQPSRDINILLANKDDAENDLGSPNDSRKVEPKPPVVVVSEEAASDKPQDNLDSPVEVDKANDDRFHYSLSKPQLEDSKPTTDSEPIASSTPESIELPVNKGEPSRTTPELGEDQSVQPKGNNPDTVDKSPSDANVVTKENKLPEASIESTPETLLAWSPDKELSSSTSAAPTTVSSLEPSDKQKTTVGEGLASVSTSTPSSSSSSTPSPTTPIAPLTSTSNSASSTVTTESSLPGNGNSTSDGNKQASSSTTLKPTSIPPILAHAIGTALGAAVNPFAINKKDQSLPTPPPPASTTNATVSSTSSRRPLIPSSSVDKWDRWTPGVVSTSTTSSPSTRRRPILPSIRRRFRPYNRFSPFPWSGVDTYSPTGSDSEFPTDSSYGGQGPPRATSMPSSTVTLKPRRRPTTDLPKELRPTVNSKPDGNDRGSSGSSSRRRHSNSHRPSHSTNPDQYDGASTESNTNHRDGPQHHRHHNHGHRPHHHRHHHHHHHHGSPDEQPSLFGSPSYQPALGAPGFGGGLFNTPGGAIGSGFDLLNPFSSWFEEFGRPKSNRNPSHYGSAARRPDHRPSATGGEYPDEVVSELGGHGAHDYPSGGRPHHGRDDYDCHHDRDRDDYDNHRPHRPSREPYRPIGEREPYRPVGDREPYRPIGDRDPYRPVGDREPYRPTGEREPYRPVGDYDTYPPNSSSGRRPAGGRPYTRNESASTDKNNRDQGESASEHQSQSPPVEPVTALASASASRSLSESKVERHGDSVTSRTRPFRPSIFTPFDTLFGSLDDDLFTLRSSLFDSPFIRSPTDPSHAFDAVISSPRIAMAGSTPAKEAAEPLAKPSNSSSPVAAAAVTV